MRFLDCINDQSGLYTLREVSIFARIPLATLRYWFLGDKKHPPVRRAVINDGGMAYLTFQDFIEAVAISHLRTKYGLPLPRIRQAVIEAKSHYGVEYPFSDKTRKVITDKRELHLVVSKGANPVQLSGKNKRQISFKEIVSDFMGNLTIDKKGYFEYIAADYGDEKIVLNPRIMFGSPRVRQSPYSAITLWRAKNAEGSVEEVVRTYRVDANVVLASCRYCETELKLAA
jgi:uncharacterized protein (DUF433 family)